MSTNIHIIAKRLISFANGHRIQCEEVQEVYVDVWQTPTAATREMMASADPVQAYKDWVISRSQDRQEPVYADDDIFCEGEPVGTTTVNEGREHIARLEAEIAELAERGFMIEAESW